MNPTHPYLLRIQEKRLHYMRGGAAAATGDPRARLPGAMAHCLQNINLPEGRPLNMAVVAKANPFGQPQSTVMPPTPRGMAFWLRLGILVSLMLLGLFAKQPGIRSAVVAGLAATVGTVWLFPNRRCPRCHGPERRLDASQSVRDWLLGRWRCPRCQAHVSATGRLLEG